MTPYEFRRSLTEEQLAFYEAEIRRAFNLEERYYRECAELRQINRALLCLLTQMVKKMKSDLICIELASKPYGMSAEASMILKDRYIKASSLPGKYAPITAGKIIADTVCSYL